MHMRHAVHFQASAISCVLVAGATVIAFSSCGTKSIPSTVIAGSAVSSAVSPSSDCSGISRLEPVSSQLTSSAASSKNPAVSSQKTAASIKSSKASSSISSKQGSSYPGKSSEWVADMSEGDAYSRKQPDVQKFTALLKRAPDEIDWQHDGKQLVLKPGDKAFSEVLSLNAVRCTEWLEGLESVVFINKTANSNVLLYRYTADEDTVYFLFDRKPGDESSNLGNDVFLEGKDKGTSIYQYYQPDPGPTNRLVAYLNSLYTK